MRKPTTNLVRIFALLFISLFSFSSVSGKNESRNAVQLLDNKMFLPTIVRGPLLHEGDVPGCRWTRTPGDFVAIPYKWGDNLQNPGTSWRTAFEAAVIDWYYIPTKVYYYYSVDAPTFFNTYFLDDGDCGKAIGYCNGQITSRYEILGNSFYSLTTNNYHACAGHEAGHGQSIGHITDPVIALMGNNPDPEIYFIPQQADIDFVNQVYP